MSITPGYSFVLNDTVTPTKLHALVDDALVISESFSMLASLELVRFSAPGTPTTGQTGGHVDDRIQFYYSVEGGSEDFHDMPRVLHYGTNVGFNVKAGMAMAFRTVADNTFEPSNDGEDFERIVGIATMDANPGATVEIVTKGPAIALFRDTDVTAASTLYNAGALVRANSSTADDKTGTLISDIGSDEDGAIGPYIVGRLIETVDFTPANATFTGWVNVRKS